jgi:hypothetical protein
MRVCYLSAGRRPWPEVMAAALKLYRAGWTVNIMGVSAPCGVEVG